MLSYVRRIDDELVEAVQCTGDNLDEICASVGLGFHVDAGHPPRLYVSQDAEDRGDGGRVGDWVIRDHERVYAVRPYVF